MFLFLKVSNKIFNVVCLVYGKKIKVSFLIRLWWSAKVVNWKRKGRSKVEWKKILYMLFIYMFYNVNMIYIMNNFILIFSV